MDKAEAHKILGEQLVRFGNYTDLVPFVESGHVENYEVLGVSGTTYQIEVHFFWDDERGRVIRVMGSIDDGGFRVLMPLTDSVLISPPETVTT